jgi:hypothetical protein
MAYALKYADGSAQVLNGRVAITRQDNNTLDPSTVQASFSTSFALPDDVATHVRLAQPQLGTSLSDAPYRGASACLEASGVEVLPGARLALDDYTPRAGYTGKLLAGNKQFYDLLVNADGSDKMLRQLDLSAFDHDWTLAAVMAGAANTRWQQGYCYDLYDRGLGAPPLTGTSSSRLFQAGYWPSTYARAVLEAIFVTAGVKRLGELPTVFDTALLPSTQAFGYSDQTRAAYELVAGYRPTDQSRTFTDEQDNVLPYVYTQPWKRSASPGVEAANNTDLHQGAQVAFSVLTSAYTIQQVGFYDLRADQDVSIYCNKVLNGEVAATVQVYVNGKLLNEDAVRGSGRLNASLTALAERQFLKVGDVVQARYKFDGFKTGILGGSGPFGAEWELKPSGRLTVQLLSDFPPGGRVHLGDWLPDMSCKDYIKSLIQAYGLTQTTDPYTGAVTFRRTAQVLDDPRTSGVDWSERRDGSQPARRSWRLGDLAQRNWFRWKDDDSNTGYAQAVFESSHAGQPWDAEAAKVVAQAYGAGHLDNGAGDTSLAATKDVLTLSFAASPRGAAGLLLIPYWKPKPGADYADDLAVIQAALDDGTYSPEEAQAARVKALGDDFETQTPQPRLVYQSMATRQVLLEDDEGHQQEVSMRLSYFVDQAQREDLDFSRSLLPLYYPHLAAALARPLVLRPYVRLSAAEVVDFDQLQAVWLDDEQAWFYVNKVDSWEDGQPSTPVELVRIS